MLNQSIEELLKIQEAHEEGLGRMRKNQEVSSLTALINPVIKKTGEKKHATIVTDDGPMSSPIVPLEEEFEGSDFEDFGRSDSEDLETYVLC